MQSSAGSLRDTEITDIWYMLRRIVKCDSCHVDIIMLYHNNVTQVLQFCAVNLVRID